MNAQLAAALRRAANLTRASDVVAATRVIQEALFHRGELMAKPSGPSPRDAIDVAARSNGQPDSSRLTFRSSPPKSDGTSPNTAASTTAPSPRMRLPLGETLRSLREGRARKGAMSFGGLRARTSVTIPEGAKFVARSFASAAGARGYKLYVPTVPARGVVVMLHGCKQDPDDFAVGTGMNALAEVHGLIVAYPEQTGAANPSSCWNWFLPAHQRRGSGEPAIIAGITSALVEEFAIERDRVFVAGLSAGGAMAVVMAETYPELYAAVGVHSGLAYGSASDVVSAFAAMRGEDMSCADRRDHDRARARFIIFHGSADQTVHPINAERILAAVPSGGLVRRNLSGERGGRSFLRTVVEGADGFPVVEHWLIRGAGHAWSGGNPGGSYADAKGPDASVEMVRFFLGEPNFE